jgi:H+/Cl- antiporter ClcA
MFGFVFGYILHLFYSGVTPGLYAVICAGAVLAGTFQMPLAAAIILFEITGISELLIPLLFATVFSSFIVRKFNIKTFNPLQSDLVDDDGKLHPVLKRIRIKMPDKTGT